MHQTPEFRALSRWGQVPVLEHDGRVFVQSAAILQYLAETLGQFGAARCRGPSAYPGMAVLGCRPADATTLTLATVPNWAGANCCRSHSTQCCVADFDRKGGAALNILDSHLSGHRFLVGDAATIADICCYGGVAYARLGGKNLAAWPNVVGWAGRIEALPGFTEPFDLPTMQYAEVV